MKRSPEVVLGPELKEAEDKKVLYMEVNLAAKF